MRNGVANERRSKAELQEIDAVVERLREFIRLEYLSHEKIAALIGVHDSSLHARLSGKTRPVQPERITAFLENRGAEKGSGLAQAGYESCVAFMEG